MATWWVCAACCGGLPSICNADGHEAAAPLMDSVMMESTAVTATTTVVGVSGPEVTLGAGSQNGMVMAAEVMLLREEEPIVHPLTGQILGVPQEPVGLVHVFEVQEQTAKARLVKVYSEPMVDDLAEYMQVTVETPEPDVKDVVDEFAQRVKELESSVQDYEKANETLTKSYPAFARRIWDEISAMRSYMVSLDERLVELEEQQSDDHTRLASVMTGEYRPEDLKEFTIKYTPDTQIKLQASGKTLLISVVNDSVRIDSPPMGMHDAMTDIRMPPEMDDEGGDGIMATIQSWFSGSGGGGDGDVEVVAMGEDEDEGEAGGDSDFWLWVAAGGLLVALLIMAILIIKRRYKDVMDGLDEFDDEYLDDEDSEEDDEDEY